MAEVKGFTAWCSKQLGGVTHQGGFVLARGVCQVLAGVPGAVSWLTAASKGQCWAEQGLGHNYLCRQQLG